MRNGPEAGPNCTEGTPSVFPKSVSIEDSSEPVCPDPRKAQRQIGACVAMWRAMLTSCCVLW